MDDAHCQQSNQERNNANVIGLSALPLDLMWDNTVEKVKRISAMETPISAPHFVRLLHVKPRHRCRQSQRSFRGYARGVKRKSLKRVCKAGSPILLVDLNVSVNSAPSFSYVHSLSVASSILTFYLHAQVESHPNSPNSATHC